MEGSAEVFNFYKISHREPPFGKLGVLEQAHNWSKAVPIIQIMQIIQN